MNENDRVNYQSVSPSAFTVAFCVCLISFVSVLAVFNVPELGAHLHPNLFVGLVLTFISSAFLAGCSLWMAGEASIIFDDVGIKFPPNLAPDLLFRPCRSWADVSAVGVEEGDADDQFALSQFNLENKVLYFYFRSGGHVNLQCRKLGKDRILEFVSAILDNLATKICSPQVSELRQNLATQPILEEQRSSNPLFTQMWESELEAHINATNFVPLETGHQLHGKFEVRQSIASGGMSAVYLGQSERGMKVVIKEACVAKRSDEAVRAKARELFEREALLLYKLQHPNIAKVLDYFVEEGRDYLVLEYISGCSLRQYIDAKGALSEAEAVKVAAQICDILNYLHEQDPPVVHRDLTPDNLVMRHDGQICLIDFGAANEFVGTMTGTVVGKQCYIAPEQFRGKASPASDIYALGCTLFYMVSGQDPDPLSVSSPKEDGGAKVSARFDRIVQSCTACEIAQRMESLTALKRELLDPGQVIDITKFKARRSQPV